MIFVAILLDKFDSFTPLFTPLNCDFVRLCFDIAIFEMATFSQPSIISCIKNFKPQTCLMATYRLVCVQLAKKKKRQFSYNKAHLYLTILSIAKPNAVMLSFFTPPPSPSSSFCLSTPFFSELSPFLSIMSRSSKQLIRLRRTSQILSPPWFLATK